jgi:hypothetical protein
MTKSLIAAAFSAFVTLTFVASSSYAADKAKAAAAKETTLKGTMVCAKCSLKETSSCQNVLKVSEGGKDVNYYLVHNALSKDNHKKVCSGSAAASVTGTVAEEGGKKNITPSAIKYE